MNFTGQTRPLLYPGRRKKPTMSVMLVTGAGGDRGVTPKRLRVSGTKMPPSAADQDRDEGEGDHGSRSMEWNQSRPGAPEWPRTRDR